MADEAAASPKKGIGSTLKTIFTMGAVGRAFTIGGLVLLPVFLAIPGVLAASTALASGTMSNAALLTSFWGPLYSSPTGATGLAALFSNVATGAQALGTSAYDVVATTIDLAQHGTGLLDAAGQAFAKPAPIFD